MNTLDDIDLTKEKTNTLYRIIAAAAKELSIRANKCAKDTNLIPDRFVKGLQYE